VHREIFPSDVEKHSPRSQAMEPAAPPNLQ
jgi:hypothetical protein